MRPRDEGRVTQDGHTTKCHAGRFEIVDRLQDRLRDQSHNLPELRADQPLSIGAHFCDRFSPDQWRRDGNRMRYAALICQQPLQFRRLLGRAVPDDVVAAVAGTKIIIGSRDRVAEELLTWWQGERHEREQLAMHIGRKVAFRNKRPPRRVAGIAWTDVRQALLPNGRTDPVGADKQLGINGFAIGKMRADTARILLELRQAASAMIVRRRKRIAQETIDALPSRQHLRACVLVREPPSRVENLARCNLNAEFVCCETEFPQPCDKFLLRDNAGTTARKFGFDPLINIHCPTGPQQQKAAEQAAHGATDNDCAPCASFGQWFLDLSVYPIILYMTASIFGGIPMALSMIDKAAEQKDKSPWPADIATEFERESKNPNPCVGSTLLSENERTRVWIIRLAPGERIGFHRHVLDYFWTAVSGGRALQHVNDGTTVEYTYQPGETRHESYGKGEFKVHDLENRSDKEMIFMTVEFKDSANKPMPLPVGVRPQSAAA